MPANERNTENIVRDELRRLGYFKAANKLKIEEQKSEIEAVRRLMKAASKSGGGGSGSPEFIVSAASPPDFLLIIECKASQQDHISKTCKSLLSGKTVEESDEERTARIKRFASDGVLHYAKHLSKEFNVIGIAISGESIDSCVISAYLYAKEGSSPTRLKTKDGEKVEGLLPWTDFIEHATFDPVVQKVRHDELIAFSRDLHNFMRDHAKLAENEKPLLVSGTLIALRNNAFSASYDLYSPEDLQTQWMRVIRDEIHKARIPRAKKEKMTQPYTNIAAHPVLGRATKKYPRGVLHELIRRLNEKVWPFISIYHDFDVVGQFYGEFLRYTAGDKKGLGIVLTPRHITELFALLANVTKHSRVLDICAGTGGFLISAMQKMIKSAATNAEKERIKRTSLVGIEEQPHMFALAASNMILRGDGKANLYQVSCFDEKIAQDIRRHKCNVGMLNPPFSQADEDQQELNFVKRMLDLLKKGSVGLAIVPMSCAIAPHKNRHELLKHHTLDAVMSLPDELFYPVGTVSCIMVFTAKIPHAESNRKTWFGYWRDDGFLKLKHQGRIDAHNRWPAIRARWVETFRNKEVRPGESVTQRVTADDEWCAEAYMETDYSAITKADFELAMKNYAIYRLIGVSPAADEETDADSE